MLWTPISEFDEVEANWSNPAQNAGQLFTPGANDVKGAWTDVLGVVTSQDSWGVYLHIHETHTVGELRPFLMDLGVDVAGGTSYTVLIANLNGSMADSLSAFDGGIMGFHYFFPIFIPVGARLAVRGQVGHGTARTGRCTIELFQKPSCPELWKFGSFVQSLGIDSANSRGVDITSSIGLSNAEGTWVSLGTATRDCWWIQPSMSLDGSGAVGSDMFTLDTAVGSATVKRVIVRKQRFAQNPNEAFMAEALRFPYGFAKIPSGATVYVRAKTAESALDSGMVYTAMAYLLGG